jgi:hypothetical protein
MIDLTQARELIIAPALVAINKWSQAAENLLVGTMLIESAGGTYVKQRLGGPALGPYQHEPATFKDDIEWCWTNPELFFSIINACDTCRMPESSALIYNWRFATIMCRIHYWRAEPPLPEADDIEGLGQYWKDHWNTSLGKGRVKNYVQLYTTHNQK